MQFRFTLTNSIVGAQVIDNPDGWQDIKVKLERDPKFHSLIEKIEVPLIFYGSNGTVDGGYDYITNVITTQGINAIIVLTIDVSEDEGQTYEYFYEGNLELSDAQKFSEGDTFYKLQVPIIQTSLWSKFFNRIETPVDLRSATDLDGVAADVDTPIELNLLSQAINSSLYGKINNQVLQLRNVDYLFITETSPLVYTENSYATFAVGDKIQINICDILDLDEIKERFTIPFANAGALASGVSDFLQAKYSGDYNINLRIEASVFSSCAANDGLGTFASRDYAFSDSFVAADGYFNFYIQKNNDQPILLSAESSPLVLQKLSTYYTFSGIISFNVGDTLKLFAEIIRNLDDLNTDVGVHPFSPAGTVLPPLGLGTTYTKDNINYLFFWGQNNSNISLAHYNYAVKVDGGAFNSYYLFGYNVNGAAYNGAGDPPSALATPTYLSIVATTIFPETTTDAFLIHDVFKSITERITGEANSFYSELFGGIIHGYAADGCNYKYAQMRGLHVRGYLFADKPFFQSFQDQWDGADPCFNLGLGYEDLNQSPYERVIRVEEKAYFFDETISLNLDFVDNIKSLYDKSYIFKSIQIGYQAWSAESASGMDDPQTKKTYATLFKQIGVVSTLLSKFFAAALAIEEARRHRIEQDKDYRLDEDVMIIALNENISPTYYVPEFNENFSDIANLNNPGSRYNLRLTPAWNFLRWINHFKGCLQSNYSTSEFKFTGGEGNYDFRARMDDLSDCILGVGSPDDLISESGDIQANIKSDYLHLPDMYEFQFKLSWSQYKTIRANRNKAIGVSQSDAGHVTCFINLLEWSPTDALADFKVWLK